MRLIVVDEEHEGAYKQDDGVSYHARDMAVVRARMEEATIVLASATPSIETRVNAMRGRYGYLQLNSRARARLMPTLEAIDMRKEGPPRGRWIAPRLALAVGEAIGRGEQALLFLNRRGYAPLTVCRTCGHRFRCEHCDAWLVEHRFRRALMRWHLRDLRVLPFCQQIERIDAEQQQDDPDDQQRAKAYSPAADGNLNSGTLGAARKSTREAEGRPPLVPPILDVAALAILVTIAHARLRSFERRSNLLACDANWRRV